MNRSRTGINLSDGSVGWTLLTKKNQTLKKEIIFMYKPYCIQPASKSIDH